MKILGIETSCDDTSVAVVEDGRKILSNVISSQLDAHAPFGGIVPEIAARKHVELLSFVVEQALREAHVSYNDLDAIAVTAEHGLLRAIVVGVAAAKSLAYSLNIPLVGVHHIEAHVFSNLIEHDDKLVFPHICLTVSGGHTLLLYVRGIDDYDLIGRTLDDAVGEVYDKVAKFLDLGFPGGPILDKLAQDGKPDAYDLPRPMMDSGDYNFSFSGLKTATIRQIQKIQRQGGDDLPLADIAASYQQAVIDVLVAKMMQAADEYGVTALSICGGVSANEGLRKRLQQIADSGDLSVFYPRLSLCTDNGAMIAGLAHYKLEKGVASDMRLDAAANAPLGIKNVVYTNKG